MENENTNNEKVSGAGENDIASETEKNEITTYKSKTGEYKIPKALIEDIKSRVDSEKEVVKKEWEKRLNDINTNFSDLKTRYDQLYKSTLTEKEQKDLDAKEKEKEVLTLQNQAQKNLELYHNTLIENKVTSELSKYNFTNLDDARIIFQARTKRYVDNDGDIIVEYKNKAMKPEDAIKAFQEERTDLIAPSIESGGGSGFNSQQTNYKKLTFSREDLNTSPEAKQRFAEALKSGLNPKIIDE